MTAWVLETRYPGHTLSPLQYPMSLSAVAIFKLSILAHLNYGFGHMNGFSPVVLSCVDGTSLVVKLFIT